MFPRFVTSVDPLRDVAACWHPEGATRTRRDAVTAQQLLAVHPRPAGDLDAAARCLEACAQCTIACTVCADADLAESDVAGMARCIRLCLDCADVCVAA